LVFDKDGLSGIILFEQETETKAGKKSMIKGNLLKRFDIVFQNKTLVFKMGQG
jgi:hypothetical protein